METTIMENQMEKKMENEMETGIIMLSLKLCLGFPYQLRFFDSATTCSHRMAYPKHTSQRTMTPT